MSDISHRVQKKKNGTDAQLAVQHELERCFFSSKPCCEYGFDYEFGLRIDWLVVKTYPDPDPGTQNAPQKRKKDEEI
jgi:hypothetical protein